MGKLITKSIPLFLLLLLLIAGCADDTRKGKTLEEIRQSVDSDEDADVPPEDAAQQGMQDSESQAEEQDAATEEDAQDDADVLIEAQEGERLVGNESAAPVVEEINDDLTPAAIISESTTFRTADGSMAAEAVSLFANIRCKVRGPDKDRELGSSSSDDVLSFTFTNRDERNYFLGYYRKGLEYDDIPQHSLKILINGRKVDDLEERCGTIVIDAGETIECRDVRSVIRAGESFTGRSLDNKLEADGVYVSSKAIFACEGH